MLAKDHIPRLPCSPSKSRGFDLSPAIGSHASLFSNKPLPPHNSDGQTFRDRSLITSQEGWGGGGFVGGTILKQAPFGGGGKFFSLVRNMRGSNFDL